MICGVYVCESDSARCYRFESNRDRCQEHEQEQRRERGECAMSWCGVVWSEWSGVEWVSKDKIIIARVEKNVLKERTENPMWRQLRRLRLRYGWNDGSKETNMKSGGWPRVIYFFLSSTLNRKCKSVTEVMKGREGRRGASQPASPHLYHTHVSGHLHPTKAMATRQNNKTIGSPTQNNPKQRT